MESDYCDVVSTNRSQHSGTGTGTGNGNNTNSKASSPRGSSSSHNTYGRTGGSGHSTYGGLADDLDMFDDRAMSKDSSRTGPLGVGGSSRVGPSSVATALPPTCSACGSDIGDFLSLETNRATIGMIPGEKNRDNSHNNHSSASSSGSGSGNSGSSIDRCGQEALVCLDCRARSRREKKLLNRLPKSTAGWYNCMALDTLLICLVHTLLTLIMPYIHTLVIIQHMIPYQYALFTRY